MVKVVSEAVVVHKVDLPLWAVIGRIDAPPVAKTNVRIAHQRRNN